MRYILTLTFFLYYSFTFAKATNSELTINKSKHIDTIYDTKKVEIVNESFDTLVADLTKASSETDPMWSTIKALLIGSILTLSTTYLIECWKARKEKDEKKIQLISRGRAKTYLLSQILKDLAMYKVHKQYYLRASQIEENSDKEDSYKKHYEKGQEQRVTEAKLDDNIAEYFELVTEYAILTKKLDHFSQHFQDILTFEHTKSSNFSEIISLSDLAEKLKKEEKKLSDDYKKLTGILEQIQNTMK